MNWIIHVKVYVFLITFSNAFKPVDYKYLISVLETSAVRASYLKWVKRYLENREFRVKVNPRNS